MNNVIGYGFVVSEGRTLSRIKVFEHDRTIEGRFDPPISLEAGVEYDFHALIETADFGPIPDCVVKS